MAELDDKSRKDLIAKLSKQFSAEHNAVLEKIGAEHEGNVRRLGDEIAVRDNDIALLKADIDQLHSVSKLRDALFAVSDSLNIAAKRLEASVTLTDPLATVDAVAVANEAKTIQALADQLLTVVGLPKRAVGTF